MSELHLTAPLSVWSGLDPDTGVIIDRRHPQFGKSIAGCTLVLPGTRGSTSSPGVLIEAIRRGNGPAAIQVESPDLTLITALRVARLIYGIDVEIRIKGRGTG